MSIWYIVTTKYILAMIIQIALWFYPLYGLKLFFCIYILLYTQV